MQRHEPLNFYPYFTIYLEIYALPPTLTHTTIHIPSYTRNWFSIVYVLCLLKWKLPPSIKWLPPKNAVIRLKYCRYGVINLVHVLIQTKSFLFTLMLPIYKQVLMIIDIIFILFYAMVLKHLQCFLILLSLSNVNHSRFIFEIL